MEASRGDDHRKKRSDGGVELHKQRPLFVSMCLGSRFAETPCSSLAVPGRTCSHGLFRTTTSQGILSAFALQNKIDVTSSATLAPE
jgi:hypothetical protein